MKLKVGLLVVLGENIDCGCESVVSLARMDWYLLLGLKLLAGGGGGLGKGVVEFA